MTKREKAMSLFMEGYNCSQSVLGAFAEEIGLDFETAVKISLPFGGGMGRMREVCGAVSGMLMVAGVKWGYSEPKNMELKTAHYKLVQELAAKFKERNKYIVCRQLLGLDGCDTSHVPSERTAEYYKKRPCVQLIGDAAEILEQLMEEK